MKKAKLTHAQAAALERVAARFTKEQIIADHVSRPDGWLEGVAALNGLPIDTMARALYVGYETDKPAEWYAGRDAMLDELIERLVKRRNDWIASTSGSSYGRGALGEMNYVLDLLDRARLPR